MHQSGECRAGIQAQAQLVFRGGFVWLILQPESLSHIVMQSGIPRSQCRPGLKMNHSLVQPAIVSKREAENLMGHGIVGVTLENITKQSVRIVPAAHLGAPKDRKDNKDADRGGT